MTDRTADGRLPATQLDHEDPRERLLAIACELQGLLHPFTERETPDEIGRLTLLYLHGAVLRVARRMKEVGIEVCGGGIHLVDLGEKDWNHLVNLAILSPVVILALDQDADPWPLRSWAELLDDAVIRLGQPAVICPWTGRVQ